MSERASIFDTDDDDLDVTDFKPAAERRPRNPDAVAAVRRTAESKGFASREAATPSPSPAISAPVAVVPIPQEARLRRRRTGRDKQLNLKVTEASLVRFYALADANGWVLGETFERAVSALEAELNGATH
jgi:hypothetical protein